MKTIFLRPIGMLQNIGTRREWIRDAIGTAIFVAAIITLLILS